MKKLLFITLCAFGSIVYAQEDNGRFFGGLESNSQWLQSDEALGYEAPRERFRANNYVQLGYSQGGFTAGVQYESYLPAALLGHSPSFDGGNDIALYYLNYKSKTIDVTGGHFYEQFGSGMVFRSWEDRRLGLNNAIKGINVNLRPTDYISLKAIFGKQRNGFAKSDDINDINDTSRTDGTGGTIQGGDAEINIGKSLTIGGSYVARFQDRGTNDTLPNTVAIYGGRADFNLGNVYGGVEAARKTPDVIVNNGKIVSNKLLDGTAIQANLGFSKKGLGITNTFRRVENYSFYSDRYAEGNQYNQQVMNFVPAQTKQQDYLLTNIYVYNPQPRLIMEENNVFAGEVGGQTDIFFSLKKGSSLGGKYGTKIAANFSYWQGLESEYNRENYWYKSKFIGKGNKLYRDINAEMKKRWAKRFSTVFTYQNVNVDKSILEGGAQGIKMVKAQIGVIEGTTKFGKGKSLRLVGQHLWSEDDRKNWAAGVLEYNFSSKFAVNFYDAYNYGNDETTKVSDGKKIHYFSLGGVFNNKNLQLRLNYGRQRGGLICVGGVCRVVPESTGLNGELNITF